MAQILESDEISDLQDEVAPTVDDDLDSLIEVWRMPGDTPQDPVEGGPNLDDGGFPTVRVPEGRDDQNIALVATYPARIGGQGVDTESDFATQPITVNAETVIFNWADNPDIRGGDTLLVERTAFVNGALSRLVWQAETAYAEGAIVQPVVSNGRVYVCTDGGTSGTTEPEWSALIGEEVMDATVVWMDNGPLRTFSVIAPGSRRTYSVLRVVKVQEVL